MRFRPALKDRCEAFDNLPGHRSQKPGKYYRCPNKASGWRLFTRLCKGHLDMFLKTAGGTAESLDIQYDKDIYPGTFMRGVNI